MDTDGNSHQHVLRAFGSWGGKGAKMVMNINFTGAIVVKVNNSIGSNMLGTGKDYLSAGRVCAVV